MALRHGGRLLAVLATGIRAYGIEMPPERAAQLARDPRVAWVEENAIGHLSYDVEYYPNDAHYHLDRIDQRTPVPQSSLKAYGWTSAGRNVDVYASGTSFAAPVVSGVAARLRETFPSMTVRQVWDFIRTNANVLPANFDGDNVPANDRLVYITVVQ